MAIQYTALEDVTLTVLERKKTFKKGRLYNWDVFIKVYGEYFKANGDLTPVIDIILDCGNSLIDEEDMYLFDFNDLYSRGRADDLQV